MMGFSKERGQLEEKEVIFTKRCKTIIRKIMGYLSFPFP